MLVSRQLSLLLVTDNTTLFTPFLPPLLLHDEDATKTYPNFKLGISFKKISSVFVFLAH